jgi:hypothetical protein
MVISAPASRIYLFQSTLYRREAMVVFQEE